MLMFVTTVMPNIIIVFFKMKASYELRISDWSSDVCSSDLPDSLRNRCRICHAVSIAPSSSGHPERHGSGDGRICSSAWVPAQRDRTGRHKIEWTWRTSDAAVRLEI